MDQNICPICGVRVKNSSDLIASLGNPNQHRCRKKVLDCIDGALKSDSDRTNRMKSVGERLEEGFSMLQEDE